MVFIDLKKAYDIMLKDLVWLILDKRNISRHYIDIIKDIYEEAVMSMRTTCKETGELLVAIGMHKGSTISPYLFALIKDEIIVRIQDEAPLWSCFVDESRDGMNTKLRR